MGCTCVVLIGLRVPMYGVYLCCVDRVDISHV